MGQLVFQATLGGQVNLVGPNTASTFNLNVPAVSSTLATLAAQTFTGTQTMTTLTSPAATNFTLQSAGTTAVTIDTSQNVGIGTTSPSYKLDVTGTIRGRSDQYFGFVSGSQAGVWWAQTNYAVPAFQGLTSAGNVGDIVMQPGGGNVGIGTTSPASRLDVTRTGSTAGITAHFTNGDNDAYIYNTNASICKFTGDTSGNYAWGISSFNAYVAAYTNGSERMRIDSSGNLLVGTTTQSNGEKVTIYQSGNALGLSVRSNGGPIYGNYESSDQNHNAYWTFGRDNQSTGNFVFYQSGSSKGYINGTTGVYVAVSDSRVKKDITNLSYGLDKVLALRPVTYLMNDETETNKKHIGFIAQEVKAVIDEAVDDLNDPNTEMYGLDKSGLVPVLVKAIQELKTINDTQAETINALTARVVALEAK